MNRPVLHHVTVEVPTSLVPATLDFYRDVIGLKMIISPVRGSAWFEQGVHLYWGSEPLEPETIAANHFALMVGDRYDHIVHRCQQLRLFLQEGTRYWGAARAYIRDPAGNRIEIMEKAP